jgi:carboxymethylenebutenolidase
VKAHRRPGGGAPTLEELPRIPGRLLCFCGEADPLIPEPDVQAIERAMAASPDPARHRLVRVPAAGHGYLCEARPDHRPEAAVQSWQAMLSFLDQALSR